MMVEAEDRYHFIGEKGINLVTKAERRIFHPEEDVLNPNIL